MTNALIVPLLLLLVLAVVGALLLGPLRRLWSAHASGTATRARSALGLDEPARRQDRIIQAIAVGVPSRSERTPHTRVFPPLVRVELHQDDYESIQRNRSRIEKELNEDWLRQAERERWEIDHVELEPVVSGRVRLGRVGLSLVYPRVRDDDEDDDITPVPQRRRREQPSSANASARSATLTQPGGYSITLVDLGERATAGRYTERTTCDLAVDQAHASKEHVEFVLQADGLSIRDLGSTNGTTVNGRRVSEVVVQGNAEIRLARSEPITLTWS